MNASTQPAHSSTPTPPDILNRMLQHLRVQHRGNPEAHRQLKQGPANTSIATSHSAPTPTGCVDELKKELQTLSKENQVVKANLLAKDDELAQSRKEHLELKIQFETLKAETQKDKEQLILYNEYFESTEKTIARLNKEKQDFVLLGDQQKGLLDKATKEAERMRQKHDHFLALLAALCYNENRRTLLRSTFLSMNVLVGLDEDHLDQLFQFINLEDNGTSNAASTTS
ncbi:unnamed protein product, partial [Mesorhabditis belari]|uniref:GRIP domain-containing protein n=1 Tax=Mesorhabditis belari TaxID=2138241 RepID=A0AAF3FGY0_9BILA